ncbi:2OG-Fe(II) oxygenase [Nostoc sp. PCC 7107]|uniref:2OG-Fe(II) oxygenase n=1 Tax=Nostoc sp. PCC 7107 TaxID=317936 RepID=UPI00029ED235|nr:2OG-Fe(II) oxygenase [Nostoc sp. PCC 7107]AFY42356.1 2OG-Fe(II) oxygenase [Nostoc sp. PCC 7107]
MQDIVCLELGTDKQPDGKHVVNTPLYIHLLNFLDHQEWQTLLDYILAQANQFVRSTTFTNQSDYRVSQSLNAVAEVQSLIVDKVKSLLPQVCQQLDIPPFFVTLIETQITAHNDGNYYKLHSDNGSYDTFNREISYVYYFYREPQAFSGGELRFCLDDSDQLLEQQITPQQNSIILFPSRYLHEVLPVCCPSKMFADSRFTFHGWIRKSVFKNPTNW